PVEGAPPSERTIVYLMCDAENLYIRFQCFDSQPDEIRSTLRTRDVRTDPDDNVEFILDTFHDKRNAYFFQVSAGGAKGDGLIGPNFFTKDWDGIWDVSVAINDEGWAAELSIPAKTISMGSTHESFGLNLQREIKRTNERIQWSSPKRNTRVFTIAAAGTITGVGTLDQGIGLDIKPFLAVRGSRHWQDREWGGDVEPGFDAVYKITPSLSATLTVNTDFAETEVDDRIVNLTRFSTFFPEKRDFFLEDASIFNFGRSRYSQFLPFFSRRIGLASDGTPAPIIAGGKITGRIGDLNIGILDVLQDEAAGVGLKNLAVVRAYLNVLEESTVGVLMTYGDPRTDGDNVLGGVDFEYRTRKLFGDKVLRAGAFLVGTHDKPAREDILADPDLSDEFGYAYRVRIQYPNDPIQATLRYREVSEEYRPDLGFVRRRGVRDLLSRFEYQPRIGGTVRQIKFGVDTNLIWRIDDGDIETAEFELTPFEVELESGDKFGVEIAPTIERLVEDFEIFDGVTMPVGQYDFTRFKVMVETADKRAVSGKLEAGVGGFFSGWRREIGGEINWRPGGWFRLSAEAEYNDIELPEGHFDTSLVALSLIFDFSPTLSWSVLAQWDDISDSIGINSRVRWIIEPGNELFFVVNHRMATAEDLDAPQDRNFRLRHIETEVTVKLAWTFRF
ncbi:MAG: carbohydrate binding family 9 domain-containing protein, partial [Planctomycetes bacterium]|nr:carbohydrate binding family 9 domain-containing protein [Planctomycetota bacterium]